MTDRHRHTAMAYTAQSIARAVKIGLVYCGLGLVYCRLGLAFFGLSHELCGFATGNITGSY